MQDRDGGGPLWNAGEMTLRVVGKGGEPDRVVTVPRPFAVIGQAGSSDVRIDDREVNARHAYLHLDERGVFAVDLVTRTGTRLDGNDEMAGWLGKGQGLEIAGRRIEVVQLRVDGRAIDPPACADDPLADTGTAALATVSLEPGRGGEAPWAIGSELVFLGWSGACGITVKGPSVAKIHCVLVRGRYAAYLVDLCGHDTRVEGLTVAGASALNDGDALTIGASPFTVRVRPSARRPTALARDEASPEPPPLLARIIDPEIEPTARGSGALDAFPADTQRALLTWMMDTVRDTQEAALRQQGEMQTALVELVRQIQQENASLLGAHLARIEHIDRELAAIRAELAQRGEPRRAPHPLPPPPQVSPLRIPRRAAGAPAAPGNSTTWLLERVSQLEEENRSSWQDLLGKAPSPPRRDR